MTKLILTDIDGTILPAGSTQVSKRTMRAFHAALRAGIHIGPASGRGIDWIPPFFAGDEQCCSTCLATNGLQVYLDGKLMHEEQVSRQALEQVGAIVHEIPHAGLLCFKEATPLLVEGSRADLATVFPSYGQSCVETEGIPEFPIVKSNVFVAADEQHTRAFVKKLNAEVEALDFDYALVGFSNIMPHGYNKGSGVCMLREALGIAADEVVVFGDGGNDLSMFSATPNSVAVANAQVGVSEAARWHIGRCDEDAVAQAIEVLAAGGWPFSA